MILSVQDLAVGYPGHTVLREVDFTVARGDCLAVLGTNGVGKSTLLKCLNRILNPKLGTVLVERDDIRDLSSSELARRVGYVSQRQATNRSTVYDAVLLGRRPYLKWDVSAQDLAVTEQVLDLLELTPFALRYLDELSGGELQKVVIARALAQEPDLLLLDEPTSNLDLKNQLEVVRIVKQAVKLQHLAAVVTMHDLNLALRFADKFLLLKEGTIFAAGGIEVMVPENLEHVYAVPVAVERYGDIPVVVPL